METAVHIIAPKNLHRTIQDGDGAAGSHCATDRHDALAPLAKDSAVAAVQFCSNDKKLLLKEIEAVVSTGHFQNTANIALQRIAIIEAAGQQVGKLPQQVRESKVARVHEHTCADLPERAWQVDQAAEIALEIRVEEVADAKAADLGMPVINGLDDVVGGQAVGNERGNKRARAGADIDVEIVDAQPHQHLVDGAQGADLINGAGNATASQHQRHFVERGLFAAVSRRSHRPGLSGDLVDRLIGCCRTPR